MAASQASPSERFPVPPYPKIEAQEGEVLKLNELAPLNLQSSDSGAGPAAPGTTIPWETNISSWHSVVENLHVDSGYLQFPRPMLDSEGTASVLLRNYSTSDIRYATDRCWFDLFEENRVCLRVAFTHNRSQRFINFSQVVNNQWADGINYNFPPDLVAGREIDLKFYLENGAFVVAFSDSLGAVLTWGAPADSMEYRADHASDAIFNDWVPGEYAYVSSS